MTSQNLDTWLPPCIDGTRAARSPHVGLGSSVEGAAPTDAFIPESHPGA
jgi:hypothetical protein